MGKSKLYLLVTVMLFELASCSSGYKLQSDKDEKTCSSCKWEVISDSMLSVQLKIAPYAYEVSVHNREARRNRDLLHYLSNNVEASDTIVFIEPIDGLTTKPWTLWSYAWISSEKDSLYFYCMRDMDVHNNPILERKKDILNYLSLAGLSQLQLCKSLDKDSLALLSKESPYVFDMLVTKLMGTRVVLFPDSSYKIDCVPFENFVIPENLDDINY